MKDWPEQVEKFEGALTPAVYQAAWRYACWLSRTRDEAEDLLQESLVRGLRGYSGLQDESRFKSWLLKIVRNTFLMQRRSETSGIAALTGPLDDPGIVLDLSTRPNAPVLSGDLADALEQLPPAPRELLALYYFEDLSLKETSQVLGISPNAVMQRLHRARQALRQLLAQNPQSAKARLSPEG